jgi:hypothetical protein
MAIFDALALGDLERRLPPSPLQLAAKTRELDR